MDDSDSPGGRRGGKSPSRQRSPSLRDQPQGQGASTSHLPNSPLGAWGSLPLTQSESANSTVQTTMDGEYFADDNTEDLSYSDLDTFPDFLLERADDIFSLQLDHNQITALPRSISAFVNLVNLDISNNHMTYLSPSIVGLKALRCLNARNNSFENDTIPKDFGLLQALQVLNLSGNNLTEFPPQVAELSNLLYLYLGANRISTLPKEIENMQSLQVLYMGGNGLRELPEELGSLTHLKSLVLCDNRLVSLPRTMPRLQRLQSLSLHNNQISTLPPEIVSLNLVELSLRNNPLVVRFVQDMVYEPPSLLELAGRVAKVKAIPYSRKDLPANLVDYLDSAQSCVNPKCKGVYFSSRVEHVKFVDFCGKYRLPLLEYLCSPNCTQAPAVISSDSESDEDMPVVVNKIKRVLLG